MIGKPNDYTHLDSQGRMNEREAREERFEIAEELRAKYGEAAVYCDACGWAMRKRDELTGELICDVFSCEVGYFAWSADNEKEEAA